MKYRVLGRSGLKVSEICLGAMTFGEDWGFGASKEESRKQFDVFAAAGGNFIDTANVYTKGTSERFVGEFVKSDRDRFVIATKYSIATRFDDINAWGNSRKNLVQSVDASLRRLDLDRIDLYWVHVADPLTPVDELMRALDDVVRAGKVIYVGVSDTPAWQVARANTMAKLRGWSRFVGLQIEYSLIERTPERDLLPMAEALGLAVTPWGPIGGGVLSGKYSVGWETPDSKRVAANRHRFSDRNMKIAGEVSAIARELGRSSAQVAIAWVMGRGPHGTIPIVGARTAAQLEDSLGAIDTMLTPEMLTRLDAVSKIELGFPHDFLARPTMARTLRGDLGDKLIL
ncbi:MAG: aldo/keto reductase [Vicinamibacteria bacterium]|nr:aldo/keto reductase [Vicinamibacteria bacterium]